MAEQKKRRKPTAKPGAKGDLGSGLAGAATGFAAGGPIGAGIMGALGLFGAGPHEDPQMRAMRQNQLGIQKGLLDYAHSVPGSSPDELANLSQSRGLLGQQQRQVDQRAMAAWNPNQGLPASQMLANLGNANIAQQMALQSGMLQDASANRRQALLSAANVGTSAADMYKPQPSQLAASMGPLMQALAYRQKQQQLGQKDDGTGAGEPLQAGQSGELNPAAARQLRALMSPQVNNVPSDFWTGPYGPAAPGGFTPVNPYPGPNGTAGSITVPGSNQPVGPDGLPFNYWNGGGNLQGLASGDDPAMTPPAGDDPTGKPGIAHVLAMLAQAMAEAQTGGSPTPTAPPPAAPPAAAPTAAPGAAGDDPYAQAMQQMMTQQGVPGASQPSAVNSAPNAAPGLQGSMAPGNQPFGQNSTMNQARQSTGMGRVLVLPGGVRLPY